MRGHRAAAGNRGPGFCAPVRQLRLKIGPAGGIFGFHERRFSPGPTPGLSSVFPAAARIKGPSYRCFFLGVCLERLAGSHGGKTCGNFGKDMRQ